MGGPGPLQGDVLLDLGQASTGWPCHVFTLSGLNAQIHCPYAHRLVGGPGQLQGDVHPLRLVRLRPVRLQADARGRGIGDDGHPLAPRLKRPLLLDVHLQRVACQ